jgi:hypothetical protein
MKWLPSAMNIKKLSQHKTSGTHRHAIDICNLTSIVRLLYSHTKKRTFLNKWQQSEREKKYYQNHNEPLCVVECTLHVFQCGSCTHILVYDNKNVFLVGISNRVY